MLPSAAVNPPLTQISEPAPTTVSEAEWRPKLDALRRWFAPYGKVIVAYSGGVDSSVVLRVAHEVLGDRAIGVIGRSDSYARRELTLAMEQAATFGARIEIVTTGELADPDFRSNPTDRCYHCKSELYRELTGLAAREGAAVVVDGTISDDLGDWRPGRRAAEEREVRSPLAELGFRKADVRAVAAHLGLGSSAKPASPCLASRIPYGTEITRENLAMVEAAEDLLFSLGFTELRVRHHGDLARIEVPRADMPRLMDPAICQVGVDRFKRLGFRHITLDLQGFRSGSLNEGLSGSRSTAVKNT